MIEIPLQNLGDMPCYDQNIVCYARSHNRRHEMLFAGSWGFEYREDCSKEKVGERVKSRAIMNMNYLRRYHGIDVQRGESGEGQDFIEILEQATHQNKPVMIFVGSYYFPWNDNYKKFETNLPHAFLALGVDRDKKCIYCFDNMYQQACAELTFDDFLAGNNGKYWVFTCLEDYEEQVDVEEVVQYTLQKLRRGTNEFKDIEDIRRLAQAMKEEFNLKLEVDNQHGGIWLEPIIFNLGGIMADRSDYASMMGYILEQREDSSLRLVKENMDKLALMWNQIKVMLLKGYYLEDSNVLVQRVRKRIEHVADIEEETAHILESWQDNKVYIMPKHEIQKQEAKEFAQIDYITIEEYYNNQCFGIYNDKKSVEGIGGMRYFFFTNEQSYKTHWKLREMTFYHEPISGRKKDSIKCNGQVIQIGSKIYDCILLMGYGDLCTFEEEIEVQYEDGTGENISIIIPDSTIPNAFVKDTMIWNGSCGFIDDIEEHVWNVGIYARSYPLKQKSIKYIKLPVCPNVILLALSLGTYKK